MAGPGARKVWPDRPMPGVFVYRTPAAVAHAAAELIVAWAGECIAQDGAFRVALAGGETPRAAYRVLASSAMRDRVDWSRVEIFWGDERTVSPDDDESNYGMAYRALLKPVGVPLAHIHRMAGDAPDLQGAARAYEAKIRRVVPITARGFPRFDAILLGMGTDGHTASLFPDAVGWRRSRRWVRVVMGPRPDTLRLTLTLPVLNAAARVLFQVAGAAKAAALGRFADPETRPPVPAQMVTVPDGVRVVLADVAAAARLPAGASGGAADRLDAAWRAYVARSHAR